MSSPDAPPKYHSERGHSRSNSAAGSTNTGNNNHLAPPTGGYPAPTPSPPPTAHCPHVSSNLSLAQIRQRFRSRTFQSSYTSDTLECIDCECRFPREHLWACLQCNKVDCTRCGRHHQKHAVLHYRGTGHCLALHLSTRVIWCYQCDAEVPDEYDADAGGPDSITPQRIRSALDKEDQQEMVEVTQTAPPMRKNSVSSSTDQEEEEEIITYRHYLNNPLGGQTGLSNLGNTCFFNAGTQALLHCAPLVAFFSVLDTSTTDRLNGTLADAANPQQSRMAELRIRLVEDFVTLMEKSWNGRFRLCVPKDLLQDILMLNPFFRGYGQHDSQEYIRCLLDNLHEGIKIKPEYAYDLRKAAKEAAKEAEEALEREKTDAAVRQSSDGSDHSTSSNNSTTTPMKVAKKRYPESSIINDLFQGTLESRVRCSNCGYVSLTRDPFLDLSLEIPKENQLKKIGAERGSEALTPQVSKGFFGSVGALLGLSTPTLSLETCLHSFCTSDNLHQKDQYKCDKCKVKVDAVKLLSLGEATSLPEVLSIHIKRFSHNSYFGSKIGRHVTFPLRNLDMQPFLTPQQTDDEQFARQQAAQLRKGSGRSNNNNNNNAAASVSGPAAAASSSPSSSTSPALYDLFAIVRHLGSVSGGHYIAYCKSHVTDRWYEFDDRTVTELSEAEILKIEAYVLFYKRKYPIQPLQRILRQVEEATVKGDLLSKLASAHITGNVSGTSKKPFRYVSRYWLKKMEVLGRPEPVDNRDLCCPHGIPRSLPVDGGDRAIALTVDGWEKLFAEYGGGPVIDSAEPYVICESCQLPIIRREEKKRIAAVDAQASQQTMDGSPFLMISAVWLNQWRAFVSNNGPRPGPITNELLFQSDGQTLLPDLKRGEHYRALHQIVWQALVDIYSGGPVIQRPTLDIYCQQPPIEQMTDEPQSTEDEDEEEEVQEIETEPQQMHQQHSKLQQQQ
jgi:ubiquitin carboxyl-terminal hydrolase 20/33